MVTHEEAKRRYAELHAAHAAEVAALRERIVSPAARERAEERQWRRGQLLATYRMRLHTLGRVESEEAGPMEWASTLSAIDAALEHERARLLDPETLTGDAKADAERHAAALAEARRQVAEGPSWAEGLSLPALSPLLAEQLEAHGIRSRPGFYTEDLWSGRRGLSTTRKELRDLEAQRREALKGIDDILAIIPPVGDAEQAAPSVA